MADAPHTPDFRSCPRRSQAPPALGAAAGLAHPDRRRAGRRLARGEAILERGPTITISFKTGEGLEAGKTKIKYRDVDIGLVKRSRSPTTASGSSPPREFAKERRQLLVEDTPVLGRAAADHRERGVRARHAVLGPATSSWIPARQRSRGTTSSLSRCRRSSPMTSPGASSCCAPRTSVRMTWAPLYFRRVLVGEVVARELDKDGKGVSLKIFVRAPYDQYVTTNTRFWNASGVDVSLDATGIRVQTESLVSILIGGIAFQTPPDAGVAPAADASSLSTLRRRARRR